MAERERIRLTDGVSLYREGPTYNIDYCRNGIRIRKSLGCTKLPIVLRWAAALIESGDPSILNETPGRRAAIVANSVHPDIEAVVHRAVEDAVGKPKLSPSVPWKDAAKEFLREKTAAGLTEGYLENLERQLRMFRQSASIANVDEVRAEHVVRWIEETRKAGQGGKSVREKCIALSGFLTWCVERKYLASNPIPRLIPKKPGKKSVRFFSSKEVEKILNAATNDPEVLALCAVGIYTGWRREEIHSLTWKDVDLEARTLRVIDHKRGAVKEAPVLDQLLPHLHALKRSPGRIFGERWTVDSLGQVILRLVERVLGARDGLRIMRHTAATWLQANGVSPTVASQWVGHTVAVQQANYTGRLGLGGEPLAMTFGGRKLESHGLPSTSRPAQSAN